MKGWFVAMTMLFVAGGCTSGQELRFHKATDDAIRFTGRAAEHDDGSLSFDWSGCHFTFRFEGSRCAMRVADTKRNYYNVFVDGQPCGKVAVEGEPSSVELVSGLEKGPHTVLVQKRTEAEQGRTTLYGIETDGPLLALPPASGRLIEFIGDSHTCGYGTEGKAPTEPFSPETENCDLAWACILARHFDADYVLTAHSGQGVVRNWADTKETSDLTMRQRISRTFDMEESPAWNFTAYVPDLVVIKLGTNDCSTDIVPSEEAFCEAFGQMYGVLREKYGKVPVLYVVPEVAPAFYGYLQRFKERPGVENLHCIMHFGGITNWAGDLGAGYHPNLLGQRKMAAAIIPYVATITGWEMPMRIIR
ncbi:SGNH/GDSL hydrolase family protein [Alistipes sp.]|uniref:SGNH/GDSL hydrolase family protein n=1 Tax=Alistipes sp. TaxID=1872444 RepID=UPI0025B8A1B6|nr:SGNH/GDSL hydrolase family protein [Alistipes sp.]